MNFDGAWCPHVDFRYGRMHVRWYSCYPQDTRFSIRSSCACHDSLEPHLFPWAPLISPHPWPLSWRHLKAVISQCFRLALTNALATYQRNWHPLKWCHIHARFTIQQNGGDKTLLLASGGTDLPPTNRVKWQHCENLLPTYVCWIFSHRIVFMLLKHWPNAVSVVAVGYNVELWSAHIAVSELWKQ